MSIWFSISLIVGFVVLLAFTVVHAARRRTRRCPACLRLGRTAHFGRFHCTGCDKTFVLDSSGRPARSVFTALCWPAVWWIFCISVAINYAIEQRSYFRPILALLFVWGVVSEWRSPIRAKKFPDNYWIE